MALYSRPDYYVKTLTARNCSLEIENAASACPGVATVLPPCVEVQDSCGT